MNNTIWKFHLQINDTNRIELPKGAEILCVQVQFNLPCLWALVDSTETEKEVHLFESYGTGHELTAAPRKYIGTYQLNGGVLVFHVFHYLGV